LVVPFFDLNQVSSTLHIKQRHFPLFSFPFDIAFMMGAHYMFEAGATINPQIGTVEDYYLINNLWEAHPMHFHLVNTQILKSYSLKYIDGPSEDKKCTFYMLDYFRLTTLT
jgi:FtsP/CotA-like multicopper oxidase with cupredoxin domain